MNREIIGLSDYRGVVWWVFIVLIVSVYWRMCWLGQWDWIIGICFDWGTGIDLWICFDWDNGFGLWTDALWTLRTLHGDDGYGREMFALQCDASPTTTVNTLLLIMRRYKWSFAYRAAWARWVVARGAHEHRGPMLIYVCCVRHMFKQYFWLKCQYNKYMFNFIDHVCFYSCE
jgi:hypothetical protein